MTSSFILPSVANNALTAQLLGGIGAGDVTAVLKTGHGALLPTILRGDCSSLGSSILLNDTGALGSIAVGDFIHNITDNSWAVVTSISGAPNSIATTPLEGGGDNTWQSGDIWAVGIFILTGVNFAADGVTVSKRERVRVTNRVSDTLTIERGYDGDTAQTFSADDYMQLLVEKSQVQNMQKAIRNLFQKAYTNKLDIAANKILDQNNAMAWLGTITGTNTLTGSVTPALTAYAAGQRFSFIVANANTAGVTFNVNSLGAKTIFKHNSATALSTGDFLVGQVVVVEYNGTDFQMLTPAGTNSAGSWYNKIVYMGKGVSAGNSGTSDSNFDTHTYDIPADTLVDGVGYRFTAYIFGGSAGSKTWRVKLGTTLLQSSNHTQEYAGQATQWQGTIFGTAAAGGSVAVNCAAHIVGGNGATSERRVSVGITTSAMPTANVATNGTLTLRFAKDGSGTDHLMGVVIEKISTSLFTS